MTKAVDVVSVVSSHPLTASASPDPVPEEELLGSGSTLADRILARARREGALSPQSHREEGP